MIVSKVTKIANGYRYKKKNTSKAAPRRTDVGNPAHMLTLGFVNKHRKRSNQPMAKKRAKNAKRATNKRHHAHKHHKKANAGGKVIVIRTGTPNRKKSNAGRYTVKRSNPTFFGQKINAVKLAEYVAGGLIGVTVNKAVMPMLPATFTQNNLAATASALAVAAAEWWAASMLDKEFGAAVGFGALMQAGSQALNAFVPVVGNAIGLSGRRGTGDFVPGWFSVPQNPVLDAAGNLVTGGPAMTNAYPMPYGRAA